MVCRPDTVPGCHQEDRGLPDGRRRGLCWQGALHVRESEDHPLRRVRHSGQSINN